MGNQQTKQLDYLDALIDNQKNRIEQAKQKIESETKIIRRGNEMLTALRSHYQEIHGPMLTQLIDYAIALYDTLAEHNYNTRHDDVRPRAAAFDAHRIVVAAQGTPEEKRILRRELMPIINKYRWFLHNRHFYEDSLKKLQESLLENEKQAANIRTKIALNYGENDGASKINHLPKDLRKKVFDDFIKPKEGGKNLNTRKRKRKQKRTKRKRKRKITKRKRTHRKK